MDPETESMSKLKKEVNFISYGARKEKKKKKKKVL